MLLHLSRSQAERTLRTARKATRPGGVLGITLKEGDGAAWSTAKLGRPRHFTYWREAELDAVLSRSGWRTGVIERVVGRGEPWLYALASRHVDDGFGFRGVEQGRVESHVGEMARDLKAQDLISGCLHSDGNDVTASAIPRQRRRASRR